MRKTMLRSIERIKYTSFASSLQIPDYFLTFMSEEDESYKFKISFNISIDEIQNDESKFLKLEIYEKTRFKPTPILQSANVFLTRGADSIIASKFIKNSKIIEKYKNLSLLLKQSSTSISTKTLQRIEAPLFSSTQSQTIKNLFDLKKKNLELISQFGVDPSEVAIDRYTKNEILTNLKNYYLFDALDKLSKDEEYYGVVDQNKKKTRLYSHFIISIPKKYDNKDLEAIFEIYANDNFDGTPIYLPIKKVFNISDALEIENSIKNKPNISAIATNNNKLSGLEVIQRDSNASNILVQKKTIIKSGLITNYSTIFEEPVSIDTKKKLSETNSPSEIQIYRCVSQKNDASDKSITMYKNIVAGTTITIDASVMSLSNDQANKAIKIQVNNCPDEAKQIKIKRRRLIDSTKFENEVEVCSFSDIQANSFEFIDRNVDDDATYFYSVVYKANGTEVESVSKIHKFLNTQNKDISVTINTINSSIQDGKISNSFAIATTVKFKEENIIKDALKNSDIYEEFKNEFEKIRSNFQDIIFYKITRTNLSISPGIQETFSTIFNGSTGGLFIDDTASQKSSNVAEINPSHVYQYQVHAYFKSPITLLKEYVKTGETEVIRAADGRPSVRKKYQYKPYKWLQPSVQKQGTFLAQDAAGNLIKPSLIEDGEIGVVGEVLYSNLKEFITIRDCHAKRFDEKKVVLSWSVSGFLNEFDHFVVVKESGEQRKIVSTIFGTRYIDELTQEDYGTIIYYVIPVYNDYSVGAAVRSEFILYNPEEVQ